MVRAKYLSITLVFAIFCSLIMQSSSLFNEDLKVGDVSPKDIISKKSFTFIDDIATQKLQNEALSKVENAYDMDKSVFASFNDKLNLFFNSLVSTISDINAQKESQKANPDFNLQTYISEKLKDLANPFSFSDSELNSMLSLSPVDLNKFKQYCSKELESIFSSGITEENVEATREAFRNKNFFYLLPDDVESTFVDTFSNQIVPNLKLNQIETDKRKKSALAQVQPVSQVVKKGFKIVGKGEVITPQQFEMLEKGELLQKDFKYSQYLKQLPYVVILFLIFGFFCHKFYLNKLNLKSYFFILGLILLVVILSDFLKSPYLSFVPFLSFLMLIVSFWGRNFCIFSTVILSLLLGIKGGNDYLNLTFSLFAGLTISFMSEKNEKRIQFISYGVLCGLILSFYNVLISYCYENNLDISLIFPTICNFALASAVTLFIFPIVEIFLGLITSLRLYELLNPNQVLLKRLLNEADGTFHHSSVVGNLAEMAADAIGANGLMLKVGAFYHDVGKLKHPQYFIENISNEQPNPHNSLNPLESAKIILEHPYESIRLCREHKIPESIIRLISTHHGNTVLSPFFEKAKLQGLSASIEDFRYQTPRPETKEEAILMLADSTEAFSRQLSGKNQLEIDNMIREMIFNKIKEGHLSSSALSLSELETIIIVFSTYFHKFAHKR